MTDRELVAFLRANRWAVEASVGPSYSPQAAIIGIAVTEQLEIIFDTLSTSRKAQNLMANAKIALVVGGWDEGNACTVQLEGIADFPTSAELERCKQAYFAAFPDGPARLSWPGIAYVRVRPTWLRYSDFRSDPPSITERVFSNS